MKNIYEKLEIPEPSVDLEDKIIAQANGRNNKYLFPKIGIIAACLLIVFIVLNPAENQLVTQENILADIEFYDDQYGFYEEIS